MMKKWIILAVLAAACIPKGGTSSTPDDEELGTFDQFSRWGQGMAGFTAPPSNQVAGGGTDGGGGSGGDDGWDDTGWGGSDADGGAAAEMGACWYAEGCLELSYWDCDDMEGTWESAECPVAAEASRSEKLETTKPADTVGGVQ